GGGRVAVADDGGHGGVDPAPGRRLIPPRFENNSKFVPNCGAAGRSYRCRRGAGVREIIDADRRSDVRRAGRRRWVELSPRAGATAAAALGGDAAEDP